MDGLDGWWNPQIYANWLHKEAIRGTDLFMDFKGMEYNSTKDNINNSKLDFDQLLQSDAESNFEGFFA